MLFTYNSNILCTYKSRAVYILKVSRTIIFSISNIHLLNFLWFPCIKKYVNVHKVVKEKANVLGVFSKVKKIKLSSYWELSIETQENNIKNWKVKIKSKMLWKKTKMQFLYKFYTQSLNCTSIRRPKEWLSY